MTSKQRAKKLRGNPSDPSMTSSAERLEATQKHSELCEHLFHRDNLPNHDPQTVTTTRPLFQTARREYSSKPLPPIGREAPPAETSSLHAAGAQHPQAECDDCGLFRAETRCDSCGAPLCGMCDQFHGCLKTSE